MSHPFLPSTIRIAHIEQQTEYIRTFTFEHTFGAKPGQYVLCWLPGYDEIPLSVAYDDGHTCKVTFFEIGDFTKQLAQCKVGDLLGFRGPFGTHYTWNAGEHIIVVGGGYGAAPMFFAAHEAVHHGCNIEVILGARSENQLMYVKDFESLPHASLHIATDDGTTGFAGRNTALLEKMLQEAVDPTHERTVDRIFACGPEVMLKVISDIADKYSVPCQLSLVRFIKSGYGACGTSVMDPLGIPLSTHGPVLDNEICKQLTEFGVYSRDGLGRIPVKK